MVPGCVPFKIVSDSPTLHSRWLLFFKVMIISLWNLLQYHSIVRWAIQAQWAEPLVLTRLNIYTCKNKKCEGGLQKMATFYAAYWDFLETFWSQGAVVIVCNKCLSPLTLWVRIWLMYSIQLYVIKLSVTCVRSVVFSGYSGFLHQ